MPRYRYTYLNAREKRKSDYVEAMHIQEAREKLAQQGVCVLKIREVAPRRVHLTQGDLLLLSKQMVLLLRSGLPLYETISSLRDQYQGQTTAVLLTSLMETLRSGGSLSQALSAYPDVFDSFYRSSILTGESVGNLEGCLQNIITVLEERAQMKKKLLAALSYPLVLLAFSTAIICFFLLSVIPSLKEHVEGVEAGSLTSFVFGLSDFVCAYTSPLLVCLGVCGVGIYSTRRQPFWRRGIEAVLFALPGVRGMCIKMGLGRFCSVVSAILQGGGSLIEGLELGCSAIPYAVLRDDLNRVIHAVIGGGSLGKELAKHGWVPRLVLRMISIGEESGDLAQVLSHISHIYYEDTKKTLTWITSWSQPIILVVLGGVIGVIMLSILLPLTSNIQNL